MTVVILRALEHEQIDLRRIGRGKQLCSSAQGIIPFNLCREDEEEYSEEAKDNKSRIIWNYFALLSLLDVLPGLSSCAINLTIKVLQKEEWKMAKKPRWWDNIVGARGWGKWKILEKQKTNTKREWKIGGKNASIIMRNELFFYISFILFYYSIHSIHPFYHLLLCVSPISMIHCEITSKFHSEFNVYSHLSSGIYAITERSILFRNVIRLFPCRSSSFSPLSSIHFYQLPHEVAQCGGLIDSTFIELLQSGLLRDRTSWTHIELFCLTIKHLNSWHSYRLVWQSINSRCSAAFHTQPNDVFTM